MIKIIIVSDTHGDNNWIRLKQKHQADYLIHAGDHINSEQFMKDHADYYVDGNNDWNANHLQSFIIGDFHFCLVHGHLQKVKKNLEHNLDDFYSSFVEIASLKPNFIIFGHTHVPFCQKINDIVFINPGSYKKPKITYQKSYAILTIDNNKSNVEFCFY